MSEQNTEPEQENIIHGNPDPDPEQLESTSTNDMTVVDDGGGLGPEDDSTTSDEVTVEEEQPAEEQPAE